MSPSGSGSVHPVYACFSRLQAKVLLDVPGQDVVNLAMTRHRLFLAGYRIVIDIVAAAVPKKRAALLFELADQFTALQSAISFVL